MKNQKGEVLRRRRQERQLYNEIVVKVCVLKYIKDPYKEKLREAIKNLLELYPMSRIKASSGLMHLVKEMYLYVTNMETVEIPDEFFDKTFIRQLMLGTEEARRENERVKVLHENFAEFLFEGTQYRGDADIYTYGAMKYLTNLKNHFRMNLERFMIRAVFALYRGLSRKGIWAIINGITNDRNYGNEVEFVDKKESNQSTNENSVIRAVIEEHRTVLGLANPTDKISALKKDKGKILSPRSALFCVSGPRARTQSGDEAE
jgi:hypothetical protein